MWFYGIIHLENTYKKYSNYLFVKFNKKMKKLQGIISSLLIALGFIYYISRGAISVIKPDEGFSRDLLGIPILEPNMNVPNDIFVKALLGSLAPFILIGSGYFLITLNKKIKLQNKKNNQKIPTLKL